MRINYVYDTLYVLYVLIHPAQNAPRHGGSIRTSRSFFFFYFRRTARFGSFCRIPVCIWIFYLSNKTPCHYRRFDGIRAFILYYIDHNSIGRIIYYLPILYCARALAYMRCYEIYMCILLCTAATHVDNEPCASS